MCRWLLAGAATHRWARKWRGRWSVRRRPRGERGAQGGHGVEGEVWGAWRRREAAAAEYMQTVVTECSRWARACATAEYLGRLVAATLARRTRLAALNGMRLACMGEMAQWLSRVAAAFSRRSNHAVLESCLTCSRLLRHLATPRGWPCAQPHLSRCVGCTKSQTKLDSTGNSILRIRTLVLALLIFATAASNGCDCKT
jgi:hypothetical protein